MAYSAPPVPEPTPPVAPNPVPGFHRDKLESITGYGTLIGFFMMLCLYIMKEVTQVKFASPDVLIFLFGFFTSEIKSISLSRGNANGSSGGSGEATKVRGDLLAAMLALIITFHFF